MKRNDECLLGERLASTKDKLVKRQRNEIQMRGGRPYFPVCVFLAGEKAFAHFEELRDKLKLFWPAYLDVLRFFYIDDFTIADFTDINCIDMDSTKQNTVNLIEEIDSMYNESNDMQSSSRLLSYFVYDSSDLKNNEQVQCLFTLVDSVGQSLLDTGYEIRFAVFHLLNERGKSTANEIKKKLKDGCCREGVSNFILSNRFRNNRTLIPQNDDRYRLIGTLIALSDDGRHDGGVFSSGEILTVKYSKMEKDYNTMATAVVETLLKRIYDMKDSEDFRTTFSIPDDMTSLLGLSDDCKFEELENIVKSKEINLGALLPLLPRESEERLDSDIDIRMTEREIDNLTLGGWSVLAHVISDGIVKEVNETTLRSRVKDSYRSLLIRNMNVYQLAFIKDNYRLIEENINNNVVRWNPDARLCDKMSQVLLHYVAINPRSGEVFMETMHEVSDKASKCVDIINELLSELATIPEPKDKKLYDLISDEVYKYLAGSGNLNRIKKLYHTVDEGAILNEIDSILEDLTQLSVFNFDMFGFVQKMISEGEAEASDYIWRSLHSELTNRQYMSTITELNAPGLSMVITKKDTKLAQVLEEIIGATGYEIYDSGISDVIESVEVYTVDDREIAVD